MKDYIHKEFPKTCAPDDFFGQVKRTVHGQPVPQEQINLIVAAIRSALDLKEHEALLDIGCGNGALSRYLYEDCGEFLGVDFSEYLIDVAKNNFENLPRQRFMLADAVSYVTTEPSPERFDKGLCYGVFSYLVPEDAEEFLTTLAKRFSGITRFLVGNLPDRERAHCFYPPDEDFGALLDDQQSPLGIWRSKETMTELAEKTGWQAEFRHMPAEFYAAHYRYDVLLTRPVPGQGA